MICPFISHRMQTYPHCLDLLFSLTILQSSSLMPTTPYSAMEKVSCFLTKTDPCTWAFIPSLLPSRGSCMSVFLPVSCHFSLFSLVFPTYVLMSPTFHHQYRYKCNGRDPSFLILPSSPPVFSRELFHLF